MCVPLRFNDDNIFLMLDIESVFIAVLNQRCELLFLKFIKAKTIGVRVCERAWVCVEDERL